MATVTFDATTHGVLNNGTTLSVSNLTIGNNGNRALFASLHTSNGNNITSIGISWNGIALTKVTGSDDFNADNYGVIWYVLVAPATGNHTLAASWVANSQVLLGAVSLYNVDQTTIYQHVNSASNNGAAGSVTITSTTGNMTIDGITAEGVDPSSPTQTQNWSDISLGVEGGSSRAAGSSSNTHHWTMSPSGASVSSGFDVIAASGGTLYSVSTSISAISALGETGVGTWKDSISLSGHPAYASSNGKVYSTTLGISVHPVVATSNKEAIQVKAQL